MLQQDKVKSWTLTVVNELLTQVAADGLKPPVHIDIFDDSIGDSPGRIASGELDAKGALAWWNWREPDSCARAAWPLKVICSFGDSEHRTAWVRPNSWDLDKADTRRIVRMS